MPGAFLRAELAPSPARWRATARTTAGCLFATALVMALHVPHGYWAVWSCLLICMPDAGATLQRGVQRVAATAAGAALAIAILVAFPQEPWFRLPLLGLFVGVGLFLFRTGASPYLGLLLAITVAILIGQAGTDPVRAVDDALWRAATIALGVAIGTASQIWLWPADPEQELRRELARTLEACARALAEALRRAAGAAPEPAAGEPLRRLAFEGLGRQLDLLANAERLHPRLRPQHAEHLAWVGGAHRVATSTLALLQTPGPAASTAAERGAIAGLRRRCLALAHAAAGDARPALPAPDPETPNGVVPVEPGGSAGDGRMAPLLRELERATAELAGVAEGSLPSIASPLETGPKPLLLTPATTAANRPALRFALKGALAATACEVIVQALHWPGIGTAVVTAVVVAQTSLGASVAKALLRTAGAVVGGLLALFALVVAMPRMESLPSLLLVSAPALGLAAFVLAGSPRISYAGVQIGLAWGVGMLVTLGPTTALSAPRDRVLGILLGIAVSLLVSRLFWVERAGPALAEALASALSHLAGLSRVALTGPAGEAVARPVGGFRWQIVRDLADALRLAGEARFEPAAPHERRREARLVAAVAAAQATFLALLAIVRNRLGAGAFSGPEPARAALRALAVGVARRLDAAAAALRGERHDEPPALGPLLDEVTRHATALRASADPAAADDYAGRAALYQALAHRLERLEDTLAAD